jgi:hypothetical protein
MRSSQRFAGVLLAVCGFAMMAASGAEASITISDSNLLSGQSGDASSFYDASSFPASAVTDGTLASFVFANGDSDQRLAVNDSDGSAISTLRIWYDASESYRVPAALTVYSSTTGQSLSLVKSNYETTAASLSSLTYNVLSNTQGGGYIDVGVHVAAGTKSLLLDFGDKDITGNTYGLWITEVQGFNTTVPEPSAIVLVTCGFIGMLAYAWRKRR